MTGSANLNLNYLTANQPQPEVPIQSALDKLDAVLTKRILADLTSGNVSFTLSELQGDSGAKEGNLYVAQNATTAGRTVTFAAFTGFKWVQADTSCTKSVAFKVGTGTLNLTPGQVQYVRADGTTNGLFAVTPPFNPDIGEDITDISSFFFGPPTDDAFVLGCVFARATTLFAGLTGARCYADTGPTGSITLDIRKNGASIGSIAISAAAHTGSFTFASDVAFAAGDRLAVVAPNPADATLANVYITIPGTRT